jgi:hypothetical protein
MRITSHRVPEHCFYHLIAKLLWQTATSGCHLVQLPTAICDETLKPQWARILEARARGFESAALETRVFHA